METEAKEATILSLLAIYRLGDRVTEAGIDAMVAGVEQFSLAAVTQACLNFRDGQVPGQTSIFAPPEAPELIREVRRVAAMLQISVRPLQGIVEVDMGRGVIRTGHLTSAEVDYVLERKGVLPDGRAMALLPADELKAEVSVAMRALPPPGRKLPTDIVPHLRRMADADTVTTA